MWGRGREKKKKTVVLMHRGLKGQRLERRISRCRDGERVPVGSVQRG